MLPQNTFVFEHFASGGAVGFVQVLPTSTFLFIYFPTTRVGILVS